MSSRPSIPSIPSIPVITIPEVPHNAALCTLKSAVDSDNFELLSWLLELGDNIALREKLSVQDKDNENYYTLSGIDVALLQALHKNQNQLLIVLAKHCSGAVAHYALMKALDSKAEYCFAPVYIKSLIERCSDDTLNVAVQQIGQNIFEAMPVRQGLETLQAIFSPEHKSRLRPEICTEFLKIAHDKHFYRLSQEHGNNEIIAQIVLNLFNMYPDDANAQFLVRDTVEFSRARVSLSTYISLLKTPLIIKSDGLQEYALYDYILHRASIQSSNPITKVLPRGIFGVLEECLKECHPFMSEMLRKEKFLNYLLREKRGTPISKGIYQVYTPELEEMIKRTRQDSAVAVHDTLATSDSNTSGHHEGGQSYTPGGDGAGAGGLLTPPPGAGTAAPSTEAAGAGAAVAGGYGADTNGHTPARQTPCTYGAKDRSLFVKCATILCGALPTLACLLYMICDTLNNQKHQGR